ncbi:MAG: ATP-dependent RecD-like DNA helicase [Bacteroidota bacterium]
MSSKYISYLDENPEAITKKPSEYFRTFKRKDKKKKVSEFASGIPKDFELTPEFSRAFEMMEYTNKHMYITGKAGTGKSTLLQYFKEKSKKKIVVLAPTGIAAINIGGATIHSFFRFPHRLITENEIRKRKGRGKLFTNLDTLVIDEVSMVRADIMDGVDLALRKNRDRPDEPFGGVQMIFFGDLYQLPPVVENDLDEYFSENYQSPFFFSAKVFREIGLVKYELQRIFRQNDPEFIRLLNNVRDNEVTPVHLEMLNKRYDAAFDSDHSNLPIILTGTNAVANEINLSRLRSLKSKEYTFDAMIDGEFDERTYPTEKQLRLREGAQVMMVKNDPQKRWFNGSLGVITRLAVDSIEVSFGKEKWYVDPVVWEKLEYGFDRETGMVEPLVAGSFSQFPIKLAWAITIHKSQGKTFDKVIIDLGTGAFTHGQAYVALSRCKTFEGIQLKTRLRQSDIILDQRVKEFLD